MRTALCLFSVACLVPLASAQTGRLGGVAFIGDVPSIDKAALDAADLALPPAVSRGPVSAPKGSVKPAAFTAPSATPRVPTGGFQASTVDPASAGKESPSQGSGLFGKLKSAWPFGKKDKAAKPATDPFAEAKLQARNAASGPNGIARLGTVRPGGVKAIPATAPDELATQVGFNRSPGHSRNRRPGSQPARNSGIVTRKQVTPNGGLLSGMLGEKKQPSRTPIQPRKQPMPPQRVARTAKPSGGLLGGLFGETKQTPPTQPQSKPVLVSDSTPAPRRIPTQPRLAPMADRKPAAQLAAMAKPRGSVTVGKRAPSSAAAVIVSDDTPSMPELKKAPKSTKLPALAAKPQPVAPVIKSNPLVAPKAAVAKPKPVVIAAKPPAPTVVKAPATKPKPLTPSKPIAKPVVVARVSDEPEALPVVEAPAPAPVPIVLADKPQEAAPVVVVPHVVEAPAAQPKPLMPAPATRVVTAPATRPITNAQPSERSRALLAEAHSLAATADDYESHSAVIQRCRYVLAIDQSQQARDYANQLASWALTKRGALLDDDGRFDEAVIDYRDALTCDDECWKAEHALGVIAAANGKSQAATRHFDRVIELNPEHAKAYANRAALAVQSADFGAALDDYAEAIAIDPDLAIAHTGRGRICHLVGHLEEALRHLDAASVLDSSNPAIAIGRGDLLTDLGRYGQAITAYRRAIALNPAIATAHRNLAWLHATCPVTAFRDGEAALASAEIAEQLAAVDDLTLDTKAAALAALGRFDEAAELQQEAIGLAPEKEAAPYRERLALYQKGEAFTSKPVAVQQAAYLK